MDVLIHGIVPKNAGLSSSSALVCVAGLATGYANGKLLTKVRSHLLNVCYYQVDKYFDSLFF